MSIKTKSIKVLRLPIFIAVLIGIFMFFRWIGIKGLIGFVIGMALMAFALLSKNPYLKWVIDLTDSDKYLWEIMRGNKNDKEKNRYIELDVQGRVKK